MRDIDKKEEEYLAKFPWSVIGLAFIFMLNPNLSIIDPLPDCFGYIIIAICLSKPSMICDTLRDAQLAFWKMALIDGSKLLVIVWIFGIDAASEQASSILLWCFVFAVLEAIFLIPAYLKLFKGMSDLGDYYDNTAIHGKKIRFKLSYTERERNLTIAFVVFKAVMNVIPEMTNLDMHSTNLSTVPSLYNYIGAMRLLSFIPIFIFGIAWFISIVRYFLRVSRDKEFNSALKSSYHKKVIMCEGVRELNCASLAGIFLLLGGVFSIDIIFNSVDIIPDVFVSIFLLISVTLYLKTLDEEKRGSIFVYASIAFYGVISIASDVIRIIYEKIYNYSNINNDFEAFKLYAASIAVNAIQGIVLAVVMLLVFKKIALVVSRHTGYISDNDQMRERLSQTHKEINANFNNALTMLVIYILSDILRSTYGAIYAFLRINAGYLSIINIACGIVFVAFLIKATSELKAAIKIKYML